MVHLRYYDFLRFSHLTTAPEYLGSVQEQESYSHTGRWIPRTMELFNLDLSTTLDVALALDVLSHTNDPEVSSESLANAQLNLQN